MSRPRARLQTSAIRDAIGSDHPAVIGLLEAAGLPVAGVLPSLEGYHVVEDQGRIVGAIGLELYGPDALLRSAVVDPAARGTGIGSALVERILDRARRHGVHGVYLLTTTADRYFPRFGFDRITREDVPHGVRASVEFQEACPESAVVMRKVTHNPDHRT